MSVRKTQKNTTATAPANRVLTEKLPNPSLETVRRIAPSPVVAEKICRTFALDEVEFEALREISEQEVGRTARALQTHLNETALRIHLNRMVASYVMSAYRAATFYSDQVSKANEVTSRLSNEYRDEDRSPVLGFDSKADRARMFAATAGLAAYALLAVATGAADAFETIIGDEWKPFSGSSNRNVSRDIAKLEMDAFTG